MTSEEVTKCFTRLETEYGYTLTDEQRLTKIREFIRVYQNSNFEALDTAVSELIDANLKWFPKMGEIHQAYANHFVRLGKNKSKDEKPSPTKLEKDRAHTEARLESERLGLPSNCKTREDVQKHIEYGKRIVRQIAEKKRQEELKRQKDGLRP